MNALVTLSDQSDIALTLGQTLLILAAIAIGGPVLFIVWLTLFPHGVPVMGEGLSQLDLADRARSGAESTTCHVRCGLAGTVTRRERADLGGQDVRVCPGHSDEGDRKGWWAA